MDRNRKFRGRVSSTIKEDVCDERQRYLSFQNWPTDAPVSASQLAKAGFFYSGEKDIVQCFSCHGRLYDWRHGDDAMREHQTFFPKCKFVRGTDSRNVPYKSFDDEDCIGAERNLSTKLGATSSAITTSGSEDDIIRTFKPPTAHESKVPTQTSDCFKQEINCLLSFQTWPANSPVDRFDLAAPGFYYVKYGKYPHLAYKEARLETYHQWPQSHCQWPENLARAGFFSTGNGDEVKCFYCGGGLEDWDQADDPWEEHARWFTRCKWLLKEKGSSFVDSVRRKFNLGLLEPNMGIPAHKSTTLLPTPLPKDFPHTQSGDQTLLSATDLEIATNFREGGKGNKADSKKQQHRKQMPKKKQTKKTKSLEERVEEAFQSDVGQFMIDLGQDEQIVKTVIRKRLQSGRRPYENCEDLLSAIFDEESSQKMAAGTGAQSDSLEGAVGPPEPGAGRVEDSNDITETSAKKRGKGDNGQRMVASPDGEPRERGDNLSHNTFEGTGKPSLASVFNESTFKRGYKKLGTVRKSDPVVLPTGDQLPRDDTHNITSDVFSSERNRLLSFRYCQNNISVSPTALAYFGFFFLSSTESTTQCFSCQGRISDWECGDDPYKRHREMSPRCPFIMLPRETNEPLECQERCNILKQLNARRGLLPAGCQSMNNGPDTSISLFFSYEGNRLLSFRYHQNSSPVSPVTLAYFGFFCVTSTPSTTQCYSCQGRISDWKYGDDPLMRHCEMSPQCAFLMCPRETNKPLEYQERCDMAEKLRALE